MSRVHLSAYAPACIFRAVVCAFIVCPLIFFFFFFFNDTATTEIYTLSLHDALPIYGRGCTCSCCTRARGRASMTTRLSSDRKSTRLNSSHVRISYAVFCLKKKKKNAFNCHY